MTDSIVNYGKVIAWDTLKSFAGVKTSKALNLSEKFQFGDNELMKAVSNGAIYATISDGIDYFSMGTSKILSGQLRLFGDDVGFLSLAGLASEKLGTDDIIIKTIEGVSPFKGELNSEIAEATFLTLCRVLGSYMEGQSDTIKKIRHPVTSLLTTQNM